ncbi:26S protease regulatory subunit [Pseudonocardia sp. MH-G8]|uniref:ATP-binding protein n=1 Tax=Pseudonocardia sp. MH-G8 TaxID=1854588 RepID=UPI000BA0BE0B|nr:ATP-binding protein [Pseudonocardia sp. MH-G8]OZM82847.1 AAA family ATPase [Pseudonocardia sp. MH-G8]
MPDDVLLTSLLTAVDAAPDDVPLRLHVAALLADHGRPTDALQHCSHALTRDPGNPDALALLQRVTAAMASPTAPLPVTPAAPPRPAPQRLRGFDWAQAEEQVAGIEEPVPAGDDAPSPVVEDIERPAVRLTDVGGMQQVKERLELAFLGPMRNPALAKAFGKSLGGGLLLYGPPGCGKTFLAKAVAGELGASFFSIGVSDVLDMYTGQSERNLARIFAEARRHAPCVLFFDELDALGQKRSHLTHSSSMRNTVNQMLTELDSVAADNEGVFVLGATNHPWDIDSALRRPGRFDRMVLVLPPDATARAAILRYHLRDRPVAEVNLDRLVKITEHFSGADLAHVCTTAAERGLALSMRDGRMHALTTKDLEMAVKEVRPSTGPWFATARNVVAFANTDGEYDDLSVYLRKNKKL